MARTLIKTKLVTKDPNIKLKKYRLAREGYDSYRKGTSSVENAEYTLLKLTIPDLKKLAIEKKISLVGVRQKADIIKTILVGGLPVASSKKKKMVVSSATRPSELTKLTVKQLKDLAKSHHPPIKIASTLRKAEIVKTILAATSAPVPRSSLRLMCGCGDDYREITPEGYEFCLRCTKGKKCERCVKNKLGGNKTKYKMPEGDWWCPECEHNTIQN